MNRELCKKLLADGTLKAWSEGEVIQGILKNSSGQISWVDLDDMDNLSFDCVDYRIKPEPEYIPFTAETAIAAGLHKRRVSFNGGGLYTVFIGENSVLICSCVYTFKDVLRSCKFIDTGTPCGVQVGGFS